MDLGGGDGVRCDGDRSGGRAVGGLAPRLRQLLLFAAACLGTLVAARMALGPFTLLVPVRAPLNPGGAFGLLVTILLVAAAHGRPAAASSRLAAAAVAVVCALVLAPRALGVPFLSDDFYLVRSAPLWREHMAALFTARLGGEFFGPSREFFRPVGVLSFALDSLWAGTDAVRWHAAAIAVHAVNSALVALLAARFGARAGAAFFAGAFFAVHGTRPEAAVWIAARYDLLATMGVLVGLLLFVAAAARTGRVRRVCYGGALAAMVLAVLSKESAYVFPLLALLWAWHVRRRDCALAVLPFAATAVALFAYRWWVLGGIGGYATAGRPQAFMFGAATVKAVTVRMWSALYFPVNWSSEPGAWLAATALAYVVCLLWLAARARPVSSLWLPLGFVLIAALPPLPLLGIGADLWNSRVLYLPSVGFSILLAMASDGLTRRARVVVCGALLLFQASALHHNLAIWEGVGARVQAACRQAAAAGAAVKGVPGVLRGVPAFLNGLDGCIAMAGGRAAAGADTVVLVWDDASERLRDASPQD